MADEWPAPAPSDPSGHVDVNVDDFGETLSFLRCFDTMFMIDDSAHIGAHWEDVRALLERVAPVCAKFDPDGIDVFFVNHRPKGLLSNSESLFGSRRAQVMKCCYLAKDCITQPL